jgi:hypothetical protein
VEIVASSMDMLWRFGRSLLIGFTCLPS